MGKTSTIKKLEGVIIGLERELQKLAPSPDRPISRSITKSFNSNNDYCRTLPRRHSLERRILVFRRRLASVQTGYEDAPALAA